MKYAVMDIETTGLNRYDHDINYIGIGLSKGMLEPLSKKIILNLYEDRDLERFKMIVAKLRRDKIKLVWQNGKFDTLFIEHKYGIRLPIHHDVMLLGTAYDLAESHKLKDMAVRYLKAENWDIPLREKIKPNNPITEKYLESDLDEPWKLFQYFNRKLNDTQWDIYNKLLRPAFLEYRNVERRGIYLDTQGLKTVGKVYAKKEKETLAVLVDQYAINWRSSAQVSKALYEGEKLPVLKLTAKGTPSGDAKTLKKLAVKGYELPVKLLDYKFYYGANSKFLTKWGKYASFDGRIHPHFNITNVVTGRTSCSDPNLQQVPRNKDLRSLFTAAEGRTLIEADYSQLELRIAADYANEPTMIHIYKTGGDIHTETAKTLVGNREPSKEDRNKAKAVNFGFLYGMGAGGFVNYAFDSYGQTFNKNEAEQYRNLFFQKYAGLPEWHRSMEHVCEALGGVENRFGRFRKLPKIYAQTKWERGEAIRRAINTPVQGTGSDLLLFSMVEVADKIKSYGAFVVGTVHDSMLVDCPDEHSEKVCQIIKEVMEHPTAMDDFKVSFKVPLVADVACGAWGSK